MCPVEKAVVAKWGVTLNKEVKGPEGCRVGTRTPCNSGQTEPPRESTAEGWGQPDPFWPVLGRGGVRKASQGSVDRDTPSSPSAHVCRSGSELDLGPRPVPTAPQCREISHHAHHPSQGPPGRSGADSADTWHHPVSTLGTTEAPEERH